MTEHWDGHPGVGNVELVMPSSRSVAAGAAAATESTARHTSAAVRVRLRPRVGIGADADSVAMRSRVMACIEHNRATSRGRRLLGPVGDPSPLEVVRGQLDLDAIARQDADVVASHLA